MNIKSYWPEIDWPNLMGFNIFRMYFDLMKMISEKKKRFPSHIVRTIPPEPNIKTRHDMANYRNKIRQPLCFANALIRNTPNGALTEK